MQVQSPNLPIAHSPNALRWLTPAWLLTLALLALIGLSLLHSGWVCAYLGTDFRGYYASAQIALDEGVAQVYNLSIQAEYQSRLRHSCDYRDYPKDILVVGMPYLPASLPLFLWTPLLDFTPSFLLWTLLNAAAFFLYLRFFCRSLELRISALALLQWGLCLPLFANLFLGQSNVILVIGLGESLRALLQKRPFQAGLWLGLLLIKPHLLVLLLPGLLIWPGRSRRERGQLFTGFAAASLAALGLSLAFGGWAAVRGSLRLMAAFAGELIPTGPRMINWRALALNLQAFLPGGLSWGLAIAGMGLTALLALSLWRRAGSRPPAGLAWAFLGTYAATCALSWHAHFYLQLGLLPALLYLDGRGDLPSIWRTIWALGPPLLYALAAGLFPEIAPNIFGLGMLALNLGLLGTAWTGRASCQLALRAPPR